MGWNPKTFGIIAVTAIVLMVLVAYANHTLNDNQRNPYAVTIFFGLFLVFVYSLIPLFIGLFVHLQGKVGNAELSPITWLAAHQKGVSIAFWTIFTLGLAIALPVMLQDLLGVNMNIALPVGKSQGTLVANVGMTLDDVRGQSNIKILGGSYSELTGSRKVIGDVVFDFEIGNTGTRFDRCRYYWLETGAHGDPHIVNINVGISTQKMSLTELGDADKQVQAQLARSGWVSGQYYYRTPEQLTLHGGETSSGLGWYWLKGNTILHIEHSRMDDEKPGEDPKTAGEWIQYLDLWPKNEPILQGLEFGKP